MESSKSLSLWSNSLEIAAIDENEVFGLQW
jgi:hypothetical protein